MPKKQIEDVKITREKSLIFLNGLVNIATHEWSRVIYCFFLKMFVDTGKVIGHTILLSIVTIKLGINMLPIVLVISGVLVMLSTTYFVRILDKIDKRKLLIGLAVLSSVFLIVSRFIINGDIGGDVHGAISHAVSHGVSIYTYLFFAFFLVAEAVFFIQLEIVLALYIEGYFSPLESQRTFPVIETAPILAGILGGSIITFFHMTAHNYIYIWVLFLLLFITMITFYDPAKDASSNCLRCSEEDKEKKNVSIMSELKMSLTAIKVLPFLKFMSLFVLLYFAISKIIEFKYTKAIFEITGHDESLTHGLGVYILIFSSVALVIQLLLSSRIIKRLGVINSMFINPFLSLISMFFMMFVLNPFMMIGTKFVFDTTSVIFKNSYLTSFYAISHSVRERIKAMIEGWLMPLGMIFGTLLVFAFQFFSENITDFLLRISMVLIATGMIVILLKQRKYYTHTAVRNLNSQDIIERYNAIEVLGEEGHVDNITILTNKLISWINIEKFKREKIKILETFGRLKDETTIPTILDCFDDKDYDIKFAAVSALTNFKNLGAKFYTQTFARYRILNTLKNLFQSVDSKKLKSQIMKVFSNLNQIEMVPFLLKLLDSSPNDIKADCIHVIGKFHDPNIAFYLKPYLDSDDPKIKANTIIALWQFKNMRLDLLFVLMNMLDDGAKDKHMLLSGIYAIGEVKARQEENKLLDLLKSEDIKVKRHSSVALAKIGNTESLNHIIEIILRGDKELAIKTKSMLQNVDIVIKDKLIKRIRHEVGLRINSILAKYNHDFNKFSDDDLLTLRHYYELIDETKELIKIEKFLVRLEKKDNNI